MYGEPIALPKRLDEAGREKLRVELEQTLDRLTDDAERRLGHRAAREQAGTDD